MIILKIQAVAVDEAGEDTLLNREITIKDSGVGVALLLAFETLIKQTQEQTTFERVIKFKPKAQEERTVNHG
jgi:hypothetical protein